MFRGVQEEEGFLRDKFFGSATTETGGQQYPGGCYENSIAPRPISPGWLRSRKRRARLNPRRPARIPAAGMYEGFSFSL